MQPPPVTVHAGIRTRVLTGQSDAPLSEASTPPVAACRAALESELSTASSSSLDIDGKLLLLRPRFSPPSAAGPRNARERSPVTFCQGRATPTSSPSRSLPRAAHDHRLSLGHCLTAVHPMSCMAACPSSSRHTRSPVSASAYRAATTPQATGFAFTKPPHH
jgi:hypothetical protein